MVHVGTNRPPSSASQSPEPLCSRQSAAFLSQWESLTTFLASSLGPYEKKVEVFSLVVGEQSSYWCMSLVLLGPRLSIGALLDLCGHPWPKAAADLI